MNIPVVKKREVLPFIVDGKILKRGTVGWEAREWSRHLAGCRTTSFGSITDSHATKGMSARAVVIPPNSGKKL